MLNVLFYYGSVCSLKKKRKRGKNNRNDKKLATCIIDRTDSQLLRNLDEQLTISHRSRRFQLRKDSHAVLEKARKKRGRLYAPSSLFINFSDLKQKFSALCRFSCGPAASPSPASGRTPLHSNISAHNH